MAKALQRRRGTHEEHKSFTGLEGEFTYDTTEKRIVAHDGTTKGGIPMAKKEEVEQVLDSLEPRILDAASQADILEAVSQATVGNVDAPTLDGLQAQIAANASNIASIPVPVRYVVEKWSSGASWYTKYSDGWIEQSGITASSSAIQTITLPISFRNTDYTLQVSYGTGEVGSMAANWGANPVGATKVSASTINVKSSWALVCSWYACGY